MFNFNEVVTITNGKAVQKFATDFSAVVTDTRKISAGALFIALKGENFDGEDFLRAAADGQAAGAVISESCPAAKYSGLKISIISVADTLTAYQTLARAHRQKFPVPIVAVTGSNGKTTTKDLTAAALSPLGDVLKTEANFNNEIGLPLTLLRLTAHHKAAVVEMGMRGLNQISAMMKIALPTIGIITNVGEVHAELLGSIDNIAQAKGEMAEKLPADGTLILNADDARVAAMHKRAKPTVTIITYGINNNSDIKGSDIRSVGEQTAFTVNIKGKGSFSFNIPMLGRHNVYNALAAIAAAINAGIDPAAINDGFAAMQRTKMRFEISSKNGYTIVNDAYNAAPASMKAAIDTVADMKGGAKIAILGDMLELGDLAEEGHREVGRKLVEKKFTALITYGELSRFIADEAAKGGVKTMTATSHENAAALLKEIAVEGSVILFKGSRGMKMEKIIELI